MKGVYKTWGPGVAGVYLAIMQGELVRPPYEEGRKRSKHCIAEPDLSAPPLLALPQGYAVFQTSRIYSPHSPWPRVRPTSTSQLLTYMAGKPSFRAI